MTFVSHSHPPQSVQLQMKAPSGDVIPAHGLGQVTQTVLLNNPNKVGLHSVSSWSPHACAHPQWTKNVLPFPPQVSLKIRVRVCYTSQSSVCQDTVQIDSFPSTAW